MKSRLFLVVTTLALYAQCSAGETMSFEEFIASTKEIDVPISYKTGKLPKLVNEPSADINKKITKQEAFTYFNLTESDLIVNDADFDYDNEIQYDNWIDILPYINGKFSMNNCVAIIYNLDRLDTFFMALATFTYSGEPIDRIEICSQYTLEKDWKDFIFLENKVLRIFDYKFNWENFNVEKGGSYSVIDEKQPLTVVEINDYQIDKNGKIVHIKTHPQKYLKEFVDFYRSYQPNSDDPMNEYEF